MGGGGPPSPGPPNHQGPQGYGALPYPEPQAGPSTYPGMLPPPVHYPKQRRWSLIVTALLAVAVVAAVVVAIFFAVRPSEPGAGEALTPTAAKSAIQSYLNAMLDGDADTVVRNTLCGMYDAVSDRKSDMLLAQLSSDAFRKQFTSVDVTTIDKMVAWSDHQTQVLFTMTVAPATGGSTRKPPPSAAQQGIAQILTQDNRVLVCSYLLRTSGLY